MNTRMAVAFGGVLVVCIVALWLRGGSQVDGAPPVAAVPGPVVAADAGEAAGEYATATGEPSLHARIVEASRERPSSMPNEEVGAMDQRLAAMASSPLFSMSREERLAAFRAGMTWPDAPTVQGPPGKPEIATGSTREEVRTAWGPPVEIRPSGVEMRPPLDIDVQGVSLQMETDRLERNEAWLYDVGGGLNQAFGFFDTDGRLTPRPYSRATMAATDAEREAVEPCTIRRFR